MSDTLSRLIALLNRTRVSPRTAAGERVYAIGDIHGRLDLLRRLLNAIKADAASRANGSTRLIFLGDLIDRGPHSRQVLELVRRIQIQHPERAIVICGNHEDLLLASAEGNPDAQRLWLRNGGGATLQSYGVDPSEFGQLMPGDRARALWQLVGADTLAWLGALPLSCRSGNYFFCHAGVRPGVALNKQRRTDLLWIRHDFLSSGRSLGAVVVHGHSEKDEVEVTRNRINVDTAAYRSGELTAVGLQGPLRWFISTAHRYFSRADLDVVRQRPSEHGSWS